MTNYPISREEWTPIMGYEGFYEINKLGCVKSLSRIDCRGHRLKEKMLKSKIPAGGYLMVILCKNKNRKNKSIHRLLSQHFIPNPHNKPQVNHKDGDKLNNNLDNLEWVTAKENIQHAWRTGIKSNKAIGKQVDQIKDGEIINTWESMSHAARSLSVSQSNISDICNNGRQKTVKGFSFKFSLNDSILK